MTLFFQTAWLHMAIWIHMVTRTHMGKNNDTIYKSTEYPLNKALKLLVPAWSHAFFYFNYERMQFQTFMVCEIPGMILASIFHKKSLSLFIIIIFFFSSKITLSMDMVIYHKMRRLFSPADMCFKCHCGSQNSRNTKTSVTFQRLLLE